MSPLAPGLILERDESVVEGEPELSGSTKYYVIPGQQIISASTISGVVGDSDWYTPFMVRSPVLVDQMAFEVTTAGTATIYGIGTYRADRDWQPLGGPLLDSGNIDVELAGIKTFTPSTPVLLRPGRYLSVSNGNGTTTMRTFGHGRLIPISDSISSLPLVRTWRNGRSFGAFPTPGTAWNTVTTSSTFFSVIVYRLSVP